MLLVNFHMSVLCLQLHSCVSKSSLCLAFSLVVICQLINQINAENKLLVTAFRISVILDFGMGNIHMYMYNTLCMKLI